MRDGHSPVRRMTPNSGHVSGRPGDVSAQPWQAPMLADAQIRQSLAAGAVPRTSGAAVQGRPASRDLGVIWDLDGTLADTEYTHFLAWQAICRKYGQVLTWETFKPTFGLGNPDALRLLIAGDLTDDDVQRLSDEKEALFRDNAGALGSMPGALELARHLHALSIPQAIGSSAPPENIPHVLGILEVSDLFEATVSRWDVERGKPAPDIFLAAADKIGVPPMGCIVLEDAPAGIAAARAGGMHSIALVGTWPEDALHAADYMVRTLADVLWDREMYARFAAGTWKPS